MTENLLYSLKYQMVVNFSIGTFSVKLPKLHRGEAFEGLDLLTTLLAPKKKKPVSNKPLIEPAGKNMYIHMTSM